MDTPENIGRYVVDRQIGRGGMAVIYLAHDPVMRRPVAIKLLPHSMLQDPDFISRFQREVETLATLEHPAIVPVYDYGEHESQPYYVMRFMSGGSLVDKLRRGTISLTETAKIISQIAPALDAAHRKSIIHRDIKPGNILFDADNNAFLSDFGIVKLASVKGEHSGASVMGTPTYMSPELARGNVDIDGRSDVYALGVLIFRMWAGIAPFTANTPMGIAMKHVIDTVPNILTFKPSLPAGCNLLIQKAMAKSREDRFQKVAFLSAALDELAATGQWRIENSSPTLPNIETTAPQTDRRETKPDWQTAAETNLPTHSSSFIGRQTELTLIDDRLNNPNCRLLSLIGPGGIGKTRLATEAAAQLLPNFPNGVFIVSLANIQSGDLMLPAIAESIGFAFYESNEQKEQLLNYLRSKSLLLILDNFEQLIDEAMLISEILESANDVKVLATSRERLNLAEEWIIQIHGMDVPETPIPPDYASYPAIQLFLDRARRVTPGFRLSESEKHYVVRICHLLEGVPLGIELAAAWVRLLTLPEIASEIEQSLDFLTSSLRNVAPRHRSLRAVFNYSWDLLSNEEQKSFRNLSVFRSGFNRVAAAEVSGTKINELITLVDKSLLENRESDRYEMQEIIRQFAEEKLKDNSDVFTTIKQQHANTYIELLQNHGQTLMGGNQKDSLTTLRQEFDNIRAAWDWTLSKKDYRKLITCYEDMYHFLEYRGRLIEGDQIFRILSEQLQLTDDPNPDRIFLHYNASARRAAFLYRLGRAEEAKTLLHASIEYLRTLDSPLELSFALTYLGATCYLDNDLEEGKRHLEESLWILEKNPDPLSQVITLHHLALILLQNNDFIGAKDLFSQSLKANRELDNPFGEAISLNNLGLVAYRMGNLDEAWRLNNSSLDIREEMDDRWGIANSLNGLGLIALDRGDLTSAHYLFTECTGIFREFGDEHRMNAALAKIAKIEVQLQDMDN